MHALQLTYIRLLDELMELCGYPIRASAISDITMQWASNEAPILDKHILQWIDCPTDENRAKVLDSSPSWLSPVIKEFLESKDPWLLRSIRTMLGFTYKAETVHNEEQITKGVEAFLRCNSACGSFDPNQLNSADKIVLNLARLLCGQVLDRCKWGKSFPQHGPGAVYDRSTPKGMWNRWYTTIEAVYPYAVYYYCPSDWRLTLYLENDPTTASVWTRMPRPYGRFTSVHTEDLCHRMRIVDTIPCRLTAVPKDARGPRLICVHPAEAIWAQQMARQTLEHAITDCVRLRGHLPTPKGKINFKDQSINANLALLASRDASSCTIDLSEASDRLSLRLVQELFGLKHMRWLECSRATEVWFRGRKLVDQIHCYAPMGNATTFPVESLVFWALCTATMMSVGCPAKDYSNVYVFGDDIIVPASGASSVMETLARFGLDVNRRKSFAGPVPCFRESCGTDAFNGVDVTPIRWRSTSDVRTPTDLQAASDLALRLKLHGCLSTGRFLDSIIRDHCYTLRIPYGITNRRDCSGIFEYDTSSKLWRLSRYNADKQRYESPIGVVIETRAKRRGDDWCHLLQSLIGLEKGSRSPSFQIYSGDDLEASPIPYVQFDRPEDSDGVVRSCFAKRTWIGLDLDPDRDNWYVKR